MRAKATKRAKPRMDWPGVLAFQIKSVTSFECAMEQRFHPSRKWRFDLSIPTKQLAIEVDGGGFVMGRHSRGLGIEKDAEKYAEAMCLGWKVLRVTPRQIQTGQALTWVERLL